MRFQIGLRVAVLDDVLKGNVTNITDDFIEIKDDEGMVYRFDPKELVIIEKDQSEMSKYSDISHPLLKQKTQETPHKKSLFKKQKNEVVLEVDLHMEKLSNTTRRMDNYDVLSLQMDVAKRKLEYAIAKRISKVVFIHGVGEGILKSELIYLLKKYPVEYYDASYQKYGLGATEVYIYQNSKS